MSSLSKEEQKLEAVISIVAATLWLLSLIFIAIVLINYISRKKRSLSKSKLQSGLATAIFIFMIGAGINFMYFRICDAVYYIELSNNDFSNVPVVAIEIGEAVGEAFTIITFILILYTFIFRLRHVFHGTTYDYSKRFYIFMYVEVFVMAVSSFSGSALEMDIILGFALLLYIFNCIFLTYLFYRSLHKIMRSFGAENSIKVMVKFVVLLTLAMSSSLIYGIFVIGEGVTGNHSLSHAVGIIQPMDAAINIVAIYFQFKFADAQYFKYLGKYHDWIGSKIFSIPTETEKKIGNEVSLGTVKSNTAEDTSTKQIL